MEKRLKDVENSLAVVATGVEPDSFAGTAQARLRGEASNIEALG